MTEQEIENNKLIAEFMYPHAKKECESGEFSMEEGMYKKSLLAFGQYENMRYHKSWDWLMPVVEKIEIGLQEEFRVVILETECSIFQKTEDGNLRICFKEVAASEETEKIRAAYKAIVEFIKWYNEQQN